MKPPPLMPHHLAQLRASAISAEVIGARGYSSVMRPTAGNSDPRALLKRLGFPGWARDEDARYPGLLIPLYSPRGGQVGWQYRPDSPPKDPKTGKVRKYAHPVGKTSVVDVHPLSRDAIIDPSVPLWITEGIKKADALRSRGQCVAALSGVYNWRSQLGTLGDWEDILLRGREVRVCYDGDILTNPMVRKAGERLCAWLKSRGARPLLAYPPELDGEQHKGADDFLAAGGDLDQLLDTAGIDLPPLARAPVQHGCPYREILAGIVWDKHTTGGPVETQLTNFLARITSYTVIDDGSGELRREFGLTARLVGGGRERTFGVPAAQFASMNWATDQLGPMAIVSPGLGLRDHARAAVQRLSGAVPERRVYGHTGWRELPGGWGYLNASGAMMAGGLDESVTVELGGSLGRYELPDPADPAAVRAAVLASLSILELAADSVTVPLLAAVYRAPLPLLPDCAVWVRGPSGALKTTLCAVAQQHYGAEMDAKHLPGGWESTANRLEVDANAIANAVFTVDDYRPDLSAFDARKRAQVVERLIRGSANQSARGRLRSDTSRRPERPPRAHVLSSAEDIPPGAASLRARMMISQLAKTPAPGAVDLMKLSAVQEAAGDGVLALALAGYVRWLAGRYADLQAGLGPRLAMLRSAARAGGHLRTAENIASLFLGWEQWLFYAVQSGVVRGERASELRDRVWKTLCDLGVDQARYLQDGDHVSGFLRALNALITSGRAHLRSLAGNDPPSDMQRWGWRIRDFVTTSGEGESRDPGGECIGWTDGTDLYLDPESSYKAARQWAEQVGAPLGVSKGQLHDDMRERGVLASTDPGRTTVRRDLSGQRSRRVLHLSVYQFESYGQ